MGKITKDNYNMYCGHANECPQSCPCPPECGCNIWGMCAPVPVKFSSSPTGVWSYEGLERRISALEEKLDRILRALEG